MYFIKHPLSRGMIAGFIGVIAINIAEFILTSLNISETALWEVGGLIFLSEKAIETPLGLFIGVLSHILVGLFLGIIISYIIYISGTDLAIVKGTGISLIMVFFIIGVFFPFRELFPEMKDSPGDVLSAYIDHIVFGSLAAYIILYLQDKSNAND